jgi:hypothetical protein
MITWFPTLARHWRKLAPILGLLICAVITLVALPMPVSMAQQQTPPSCYSEITSSPNITYTVSGKQILVNGTTPLVPYGVQLGGITMAVTNWRTNNSSYITPDMIAAAESIWHSNTVSLQLASANLLNTDSDEVSAYLSRVDQIVNCATYINMNIILVLQYEATNPTVLLPTQDSINFWDVLSARYAYNSRVIFDAFNEPKMPNGAPDDDAAWTVWRNGGTDDGITTVGMQALVNTIRANAPNNLILVEGLAAGEGIALLPSYTLTGSNIAYAIHPYLSATEHATPGQWDSWFGNAARNGNFPVVADEWGEYQSSKPECYPTAPQTVPTFLTYLRQFPIGVVGYALYPGTLIRGWDFSNPTQFDQTTYTCPTTPIPNLDPTAQGAGQLLMNYFQTYSKPL